MFEEVQRLIARFLRGPGMKQALEDAEKDWKPPQPAPIDHVKIIRDWLVLSGLSHARDEDVRFYVDAYLADELNFRDVRKRGTPLAADEKVAIGTRYRGILTRDFIATLSEQGLADPVMAAQMISQPASHRCHVARNVNNARAHGLKSFGFQASNMLAGPCPRAAALDGQQVSADNVELVPFNDCTHPDQCACMYRDRVDIDAD